MSILHPPSILFDAMLREAKDALKKAYAKYSNFQVGACIKTADGQLFKGCNVENSSYPMTQCAEASAIGNMVTHGYQYIAEILIIADTDLSCPPCGACRQKIVEFADQHTLIHMCNRSGDAQTMTINQLLPFHFGSDYLSV